MSKPNSKVETVFIMLRVNVCGCGETVYLDQEQIQKLEAGEKLKFEYNCGDVVTICKDGIKILFFNEVK